MHRPLLATVLAFAFVAFAVPISHYSRHESPAKIAMVTADVPDLVIVADRVTGATTAYTRTVNHTWGDIPDLVVTSRRPAATSTAARASAEKGATRL